MNDKKHKPKFSILVPAFKATFLSECIESIISQEYRDFELIIVNDASPYNLDSIVVKYKDPRIQYYKNEVGFGAKDVVKNWDKCLEYSSGEFVICMGDDDKLLPNCLTEYSKLTEAHTNVDVFHGWTEIIDEESNIYDINEPRPVFESVYSLIYYRLKGRQQYIGDFLFRSSRLKNIGGFYYLPMAWGSDDITTWLIAQKHGIINTQVPVFLYRKNRQTLSNSGSCELQINGVLELKNWLNEFLSTTPKNDIDKLYHKKILEYLPHYINVRKQGTICKDLSANGTSRILWWLRHKKSFTLSYTNLLKPFLSSLKHK